MAVTGVRAATDRPGAPTDRSRLLGLDLARAVAMLGMLVVHTIVTPTTQAEKVFMWANGWVGPLFVLLAGTGLSLAARTPRTTRFRLTVIARTAPLLLIGLLLETQMYGAILHYFALYFLLGVLALPLPRKALAGLAAFCLVGGPLVITYLVHTGSIQLERHVDVGLEALGDPVALVRALAVDGIYPAIVWSGFFFAGMVLGRTDLRDRRLPARLVAGGGGLGLGGTIVGWAGARRFGSVPLAWTHHWTTFPHTEAVAWAVTNLGFALAFTGVALWIADRAERAEGAQRPARLASVLAPLAAVGQMALTFYLLHLWYVDTLWERALQVHLRDPVPYVLATLAFYLLFAAGAWLWLRVVKRGPVEAVLHGFANLVVRPRPLAATPDTTDR